MTASFKKGQAAWWAQALWLALTAGSLLVGLAALIFILLPFSQARSWFDQLSADGSFERLTPDVFASLQAPVLLASMAALLVGAALVVFWREVPTRLERLPSWLGSHLARDAADMVRGFSWKQVITLEVGGVILLTLAAALVRVLFLTRPMVHDESYTVVAFALRSLSALISDYHLPNNHIFHSLLVKLSSNLFGIAPWAVRLPAYIAGVLCVPATYWLAKRLYGSSSAWISAAVVTALPVMILYSSNARGYSLFTLLSLLVALLAVYLKDHRSLTGWLLLALLFAVGFYTLPVMLYPFGMVMTWLLLSALIEKPEAHAYGSRFRLIRYLAASAFLALGLAALLYLPVIAWGTGLNSLVGNPFVSRLSWQDLPETLNSRLQDTWQEWNLDLPGWPGMLLAAGFGLGLALHRRISRVRVPMQLAAVLWLVVILLAQRPNAYARMWTFLIPFAVIWSVAGLVEPLSRVRLGKTRRTHLGLAAVIVVLVGLSAATWVRTLREYPGLQPYPGEMEQVVSQVLMPRVKEGDIVIISSEDSPVLWYYFKLYGIPDQTVHHLEKEPFPFKRAFVVVSEREGQTLVSAVEMRGLRPQDFALESAQTIGTVGLTTVYACMAR
jgi:hypothetical protein